MSESAVPPGTRPPGIRPPGTRRTYLAADSNEFGRGISFFDAIYGFSATLLIANLDAPPGDAWQSVDALLDSGIGSQLFGFALSFAVIVLFWRSNVALQRSMTGLDGPTITANLLAVALVMLIPFTTQGISDPSSNDFALPTALYALNIALASLAQIAFGEVGRLRGLVRDPLTGRARAVELAAAWLPPVVFGISIPIALTFGPAAGQWTWLSLAFGLPLLGRFDPARS
ncbi:MAG: TMEM175 family protein [Gordonia sp. (in: high G+C Gram-positive bacteria)]|uniref:TMEM175 family protein n=1 Tax=Gordonia sp. (in: high G+C Gram-positive bacteria) TaxID=84139 RepID=UPI003BB664C6